VRRTLTSSGAKGMTESGGSCAAISGVHGFNIPMAISSVTTQWVTFMRTGITNIDLLLIPSSPFVFWKCPASGGVHTLLRHG